MVLLYVPPNRQGKSGAWRPVIMNMDGTEQGVISLATLSSRSELQARLARRFRDHVRLECFDTSGIAPCSYAIYSLADPRDIRDVRYVGQTTSPRRRFLQHLNIARLWLPDETPWWVASPTLRPLSTWIRKLYQHELRLPVMVITTWVEGTSEARIAERSRICECLAERRELLNVERENLGRQAILL